ncbi:MAG: Uncharacterised protein [Flavobacteriia bacterium]|nr:MAG: Uncharacterised protein [Flavobacteriia bacterium]
MKKFIILLSFSFLFSFAAHAQDAEAASQPEPSTASADADRSFGMVAHAGLLGYGADFATRVNPHLILRAGVNFFQLEGFEDVRELAGRSVLIVASNNTLSFDMMGEYYPWQKSSFKLIFGGSYIQSLTANAMIMVTDPMMFGEIELTPEQVGEMDIELAYGGMAPFLGIGFGRSIPNKRIGLGLEVGSYYIGSPSVNMNASELLEPSASAEQEKSLEESFRTLSWLPAVKFRLAVRL